MRSCFFLLLVLLTGGCASSGANSRAYWLDEKDVLVAPSGSALLHFTAPDPPGARPALWLAPRAVFVMEERLTPALSIKVNGRSLGAERLLAGGAECRQPCSANWPTAPLPTCSLVNGQPQWLVRFDDNFTIGEADTLSWRRQYASEGLAPSYLLDLTGLVRPGDNTLELGNSLDAKTAPRAADLTFLDNPEVPYFTVHSSFVRVGSIPDEAVAAYNAAHTKPFDPRIRTFDVRDPGGFQSMERYYAESAARSDTPPELRALLRMAQANFEIWKGNYSEAAALLVAMRRDAPASGDLPENLFLSGVALSREGKGEEAAQAWSALAKQFAGSPWSDLEAREAAIVSWKGQPGRINWPVLEAVRAESPVAVDGKLEEAVWQKAPVADAFFLYPYAAQRPSVRTEARAAYDERGLYLSITSFEPAMDEIRNPHRERDSAVWYDDNVEWFLDPGRTYVESYEFELGVDGGLVDCQNIWQVYYLRYDPPRVDKVARYADRWTAETALTWEALGVKPPKPGDVWLCNVVRNRPASAHRPGESIVLGHSTGRFSAPESAALLIFR